MSAFDLPPELEKKEQVLEKLPRSLPFDANRIKAAGEVLERAERINKNEPLSSHGVNDHVQKEKEDNGMIFHKFFDDVVESTPPSPATKSANIKTRTEAILSLAEEGKTDIEIASELGITRNEVLLVIGLRK